MSYDWGKLIHFADKTSSDPDKKIAVELRGRFPGAIFAANTLTNGQDWSKEKMERPIKYSYIEHAERNAIYEAARLGFVLIGAKMWCMWFPCVDCARAIVQSGISTLIYMEEPKGPEETNMDWKFDIAREILIDGGVQIHHLRESENKSVI